MRAAIAMLAALLLIGVVRAATTAVQETPAQYAGSEACRPCHTAAYDQWKPTLMANVVRDPRQHPDAIIPDLSRPDPLLTFDKDRIAFVYGSKWKQRYFTKVGDDYFPLGAQWDVTHKLWRPYFVAANTDWWTSHYEADNMKRPTGALCDGCHSVNYDIQTKSVTEWNVGCERCHGPGKAHAAAPRTDNIVNPAKGNPIRANDICISCHSQGEPTRNPINGKYYDWPVGYHAGANLSDYWTLDAPTLGTQTFTFFADGTSHKNRMQGNDFVTTRMYQRGVTCWNCHNAHGSPNPALLRRPVEEICSQCHRPGGANGPAQPTLEQHTHHQAGSAGSSCVACHMPKIEQTIADVNVRSHTFRFIPPSATDRLKVPNPCTSCHAGRTTAWASGELKKWPEFSAWRVAE